MSVADLERRLRAAQPAGHQPEPQRRRNAVARYAAEREAALASPDLTPLRRARLTAGGAGMSMRALAILAGVSRDSVSRAERGDGRVSDATWRRLATALGRPIDELRP